MTQPLRLGLLGNSSIARRKLLPAAQASDRIVVKALASRQPASAAEVARTHGIPAVSYEALLAAPDVDAVYVSVPTGLHADWGRRVLEAGKHLLLEKTFTDCLGAGRALVALARERGLVAMEALSYVYHPLHRTALEAVAAGTLGALQQLQADFCIPARAADDIRNDPALGGGAILDVLIYPLSAAWQVLGRPAGIHAYLPARPDHAVDTRGFLQLDWEGGCSAHLSYGFGMTYRNGYRVFGEDGHLAVARVFSMPADLAGTVEITRPDGSTESRQVAPADAFARLLESLADKVQGRDDSGINEGAEILDRLEILTRLYAHYRAHGGGRVDL